LSLNDQHLYQFYNVRVANLFHKIVGLTSRIFGTWSWIIRWLKVAWWWSAKKGVVILWYGLSSFVQTWCKF